MNQEQIMRSQELIDQVRGDVYKEILNDRQLLDEFIEYKIYNMMTMGEMFECIDQLIAEVLVDELF